MKETNPFILSLPELMERRSFLESIKQTPDFPKMKLIQEKVVELEKINTSFFMGQFTYYYFYERFMCKMISSYRTRAPETLIKKLMENKHLSIDEKIKLCEQELRTAPSVFGTYLIGIAGTGKTTIINKILSLFKDRTVVDHKSLGIKQIPILKLHTPYRASRKDLCKDFLKEIDSIADTDWSKNILKENEADLAERVRRACIIHFIGTIILDEFQDLRTAKTGPSEITLAFIKYLTNVVGVPIIFVGSLEVQDLLFGNFQLATRSQGFKLKRFEKDKKWDDFIDALFACRVLHGQQKLSSELKEAYYDLTQGIPRLLNMLHTEAQKICLHSNKQAIEIRDLLIASKNLFSGTDMAIYGIKNYDAEVLSLFPDLHRIVEDEQIINNEKLGSSKQNSNGKDTKSKKSSNRPPVKAKKNAELPELVKNCRTEIEAHELLKRESIIPDISAKFNF